MTPALRAVVDFMWERFPRGDDVPAFYQPLQADMADRSHGSKSHHHLSQKAPSNRKASEDDIKDRHSQLVVRVDISSLDDCFNFAQIPLNVFNWPIVRGPSERRKAQRLYGLG